MGYKKIPYELGKGASVLEPDRKRPKEVTVRRRLPGNIIIVHGVNDVGTSYAAVESGLCEGLEDRLLRRFKAGTYRNPENADKKKIEPDPDAVFYKRLVTKETDSPVIPFYWGYRELKAETKTVNGQKTDRFGTRLDKDLAKGGGPFVNATSTLPDMWNKGICAPVDLTGDPIRPLVNGPGRMYMILAARRLAALISMIRDYDSNETVSIVAHSQGCLISLLAQAFLMEQGLRPVDTLILTHPPYSLDETTTFLVRMADKLHSGTDAAMEPYYGLIDARQTLHGRLQTLINIVRGVESAVATAPAFASLGDNKQHGGMVDSRWKATADRDNRGKVYLYFCPEDMTVALDNVRGIGWQGVPDYIEGSTVKPERGQVFDRSSGKHRPTGPIGGRPVAGTRKPLQELGTAFRQRVFTDKTRFDRTTGKFEWTLVGQPPHDFPLRVKAIGFPQNSAPEDDHGHVEKSGRDYRTRLPVATWPPNPHSDPVRQRIGIRSITGEALHPPCRADLRGNQVNTSELPPSSPQSRLPASERGPCEEVDPIDAAIATANGDLRRWYEVRPDPSGHRRYPDSKETLPPADLARMTKDYNVEKAPRNPASDDLYSIIEAFRDPNGQVFALIQESNNAARLRWQNALSAKSFHGAIIGSASNHRHVTAYDVAIGGGQASTDPNFYAYLCAVADWRLKKPTKKDLIRPGILLWEDFVEQHRAYWAAEPAWRKDLIEGNADYYSSGMLPSCLPVLTGKLWRIIVSETIRGTRVCP